MFRIHILVITAVMHAHISAMPQRGYGAHDDLGACNGVDAIGSGFSLRNCGVDETGRVGSVDGLTLSYGSGLRTGGLGIVDNPNGRNPLGTVGLEHRNQIIVNRPVSHGYPGGCNSGSCGKYPVVPCPKGNCGGINNGYDSIGPIATTYGVALSGSGKNYGSEANTQTKIVIEHSTKLNSGRCINENCSNTQRGIDIFS